MFRSVWHRTQSIYPLGLILSKKFTLGSIIFVMSKISFENMINADMQKTFDVLIDLEILKKFYQNTIHQLLQNL